MALPKQRTVVRPESGDKISLLAKKLLREAEVTDVLPTPLNQLFEIARVTNVAELPDAGFFATLNEKSRFAFLSALQKIRGIADLRERVTYVPQGSSKPRERFVRGHELGHQVIPWHNVDPTYLDYPHTLIRSAKSVFEQEANLFSAEVMFQGDAFRLRARDYAPSLDAIFKLADLHHASRQCTAWRFVEEQDEPVALLQYYPGNAFDDAGNRVLHLWCTVPSRAFTERYADLDLPHVIRTGHDWMAAKDFGKLCTGTLALRTDNKKINFEWHSWWNRHTLLVLLRRKPLLRLIGKLVS